MCLCSVVGADDLAPFHEVVSGTGRSGTMSCMCCRALSNNTSHRRVMERLGGVVVRSEGVTLEWEVCREWCGVFGLSLSVLRL
jgi:hypothetical protein